MSDILSLIGVTSSSLLGSLLPAAKLVQQMADTYGHITFGQKRCKTIVQRAALIIKEVHCNSMLQNDKTSTTRLEKMFGEIQSILQQLADMSFFKALLRFEDIDKQIEHANRLLTEILQLFAIDVSLHAEFQSKAVFSDRDVLRTILKTIAGNYEEIRRRFGLDTDEQVDEAMVVMERELRNSNVTSGEDMPVELKIIQKSLECMKTTTGRSTPKQCKWLITEYDLDYCGIIGGGGFSTVYKSRFRGTIVAVKKLKDFGNTKDALERELEIWSRLRHDHIVPFYGASTLTSPPYIVSRYMQNGNLVQYLLSTPNADRTKLVLEVSLGMYYLHEESIIHGDLKGVNVLVDDAGKACITDFGLSRVRSSNAVGTKMGGTLRFLAPEALNGRPLSFETDVYAFGMVIYEVFTGEVPFIREPDYLVLEGRVKLHRPTSNIYDRGFSDKLWKLLSDCISGEPAARPRFETIQERLRLKRLTAELVHADGASIAEGYQLTDWGLETKDDSMVGKKPTRFDSRTLFNAAAPPPCNKVAEQSKLSVPPDIRTFPPLLLICIQVTHKYFGVQFGVSREPGVYLEEANKSIWQPIRAGKGTLLYQDGNKFWYRSSVGQDNNSWELGGNDVTLRTASVDPGICRFRDARMAQRWFGLQLSYARDGSVYDWGTAVGDWFCTERSWRRLSLGSIQQADLVDGDPNKAPTDRSWNDVNLPKRCIIDNDAGIENCIVCAINPGKHPGKLCCKLEGRRIVFETFRQQRDKEPMNLVEETYPSEENAEVAFYFLNAALGKLGGKHKKLFHRLF